MPAKLSVEAISHRYSTVDGAELSVLEDISFDIQAGEFISVIGASGSGKTTLLRILASLMRPSAGRVLIDGEAPKGPSAKMAVVFQRDSLWPWRTVLDNTLYGLEIKGVKRRQAVERAQRYLEMVGLKGFAAYYPHQLSGGMRQRVNLARALTVEPDILLMDEPFSALDSQTREVMQVELTRIWQETAKTIVFITHQIDEAVFLSDRVITFSARPGSVRAVTPIALDRPRNLRIKRTEQFQTYVGQLWDLIEHEVMKGFQAETVEP
ncbi:MAG TPA: ABC transporter ATP-binding protein [Stellaceae bacterium]|nr:ABC transporter ATP-binding protein [Stellaceae bacterium]